MERICIGAIAGAFGVKGDVRIKSFCSNPDDIFDYSPLTSEDGARKFTLTPARAVAGGLGARLAGVATKEEADALKGVTLWAERSQLPSLPDDEFYHADLIGLEVMDSSGARVGRVHAMHNHGAGDIIEILTLAHKSLLLPFTLAIVPTVDLKAGRIVVDLPEDPA